MDNSQQIYPETSSPPQLEPVTMDKGDSGDIIVSVEKPSFVEDDPQLALQGSTLMNLSDMQNQEFAKIKWLHFSAFLFFLIQTIIYSSLSVEAKANPSIGVPGECEGTGCKSTLQDLGETNPIWIIPLFCALACFDHLVCFGLCYQYSELTKYWIFDVGSNPLRWLEYSVSASFMAVAISILCGITDVHLWLSIFIMHGVGMLLGIIIEILPKKEDVSDSFNKRFQTIREIAYWLAFVSIFSPWLVMCCYFFRAIDDSVPKFVYAAFLGTLVLFLTFGINSYLHNILNLYSFTTAEIIYISLSFTAKTFLAGDVFGGLNASGN